MHKNNSAGIMDPTAMIGYVFMHDFIIGDDLISPPEPSHQRRYCVVNHCHPDQAYVQRTFKIFCLSQKIGHNILRKTSLFHSDLPLDQAGCCKFYEWKP